MYVPQALWPLMRPEVWKACIEQQYAAVVDMDASAVRRAFLDIIMKLFPLYGSNFFVISVRGRAAAPPLRPSLTVCVRRSRAPIPV